jgi:hypothetical protein
VCCEAGVAVMFRLRLPFRHSNSVLVSERDCHTNLSLAKSGMVGKSKNRKRAGEHLKNFSELLRLLINVNRNMPLSRKGMEIATFLPIAAGKFSILSYCLVADIWAFPSGFPIPFRNFPEAAQ